MSDRRWTAADFDYPLPEDLIAQLPAPERGGSRLLVVHRPDRDDEARHSANFADSRFAKITDLILPGDLVVVNTSRVRHARLPGTRPGGGAAELLLIHPADDDTWIAMGSPGRALQPGKRITLGPGVMVETLAVDPDGMRRVRFIGISAARAIERFGRLPLPPYIQREPTAEDERRYQTVYADRDGSVAAPTAGLHFTTELLDRLRAGDVTIASLDLEVGPGTFRPLEDGDIDRHVMHAERFDIPPALASAVMACREAGGSVWAIGTTVVRALESAALDDRTVAAGSAETRLMIAPGFNFRVVDRLVTNFHLPRTTLLALVSAFAGHATTMAAYRHAIEQRYRFYSYGDAMCVV